MKAMIQYANRISERLMDESEGRINEKDPIEKIREDVV